MIESIEFKNFKSLRDTTLPLGPCTILVGPNGSGKSTVLQALEAVREPQGTAFSKVVSFGGRAASDLQVSVKLNWGGQPATGFERLWTSNGGVGGGPFVVSGRIPDQQMFTASAQAMRDELLDAVGRIRVFSLESQKIAAPAPVRGIIELAADGSGLASALDGMRDEAPDSFKAIESEIGKWLPEFDCILFDRPGQGAKSVALRTREGGYKVPARDLSQGTLIALALLTLAYHPARPSLIALEEPVRGLLPHLLRHILDTLHRLCYPESCGEAREPVQVIATTHSPYFLDLFREMPDEVVVANKKGLDVQFQRLTDSPNLQDILGEAALGDAWFSGVLGGVPSGS